MLLRLAPICRFACALGLTLSLSMAACSRGGAVDSPGQPDAGPAGGADAGSEDAAGADLSPGDAAPVVDLAFDARPVNDDPFDPASCDGPALPAAQALMRLGAAPRLKLADATLYRRTRSCTGMTPDTCGAWGAPVMHQQALLTYSGGVVTDYKTFSFPTHLILYAQAGQPRFSIRHESDYRHDATANARGVVFSFGADPMENTYPVIYVWDFAPAPNRYDDLQGLLGKSGQLHATASCARVVFYNGPGTEIAAVYRY